MQIDLGDFASTLLLQRNGRSGDFSRARLKRIVGEDDEYFIEVVGSMYEVAPVLSFLHTTTLLA